MTDAQDHPQIYLITPSEFDLSTFPAQLAACLDSTEVACVRLALGAKDETRIAKAADALRELTHARDVALVIDSPRPTPLLSCVAPSLTLWNLSKIRARCSGSMPRPVSSTRSRRP